MKRYSIFLIIILVACTVRAQNRKYLTNFSQFQQYFNPALTGYQGTAIKSYYRDQWSGFDHAPKTMFVAGEMNLADVTKAKNKLLQHGFGVVLLHDTYGAQVENQLALSYSSGVQLTEGIYLKAGIALTYNNFKIDQDKLAMDDYTDPSYLDLVNGQNKNNHYGINVGVALTSADYYAAYTLNDVIKKEGNENQGIVTPYVMQHVLQAGYRREVAESIGLIINGIYRYDKSQKGIVEGQLKGVLSNTLWVGVGYRNDIAYTFNAGVRIRQIQVAYAREMSSGKVDGVYRGGNEITLSYHFKPVFGKKLSVW